MPKKKTNPKDIRAEIKALDLEIAELEAQRLAEERAVLAEPLRQEQDKAIEAFGPFEEAVNSLRAIWNEIEEIVVDSEKLRKEIKAARDRGREDLEASPPDLTTIAVPDSLLSMFAVSQRYVTPKNLSGLNQQVFCGRRYIFSRLRRGEINGMTKAEQRALV